MFFPKSPSESTVNHFTAPNLQTIKSGKAFFTVGLRSHYQRATIYLMIFDSSYYFCCFCCFCKMLLNSVVLCAMCWLNTSLVSPCVPLYCLSHTVLIYTHTHTYGHKPVWKHQQPTGDKKPLCFSWLTTDRTWKLSQTIKHRMSPSMDCSHLNTPRIIGLSHSSHVTQRDWSRSLIKSLQLHKNQTQQRQRRSWRRWSTEETCRPTSCKLLCNESLTELR